MQANHFPERRAPSLKPVRGARCLFGAVALLWAACDSNDHSRSGIDKDAGLEGGGAAGHMPVDGAAGATPTGPGGQPSGSGGAAGASPDHRDAGDGAQEAGSPEAAAPLVSEVRNDATSDAAGGAWTPLAPTALYLGTRFEDRAAEWGKWSYAEDSCADPFFDDDGSLCTLYQPSQSSVFFFASADQGTTRTKCQVPRGQALLFPLVSLTLDNAGVAPAEQLSKADLQAYVDDYVKSARDLVFIVDGVTITGLDAYAVGPTQFSYTLPPEPNWYSCNGQPGVDGTVDPSYVGGVFVLMPPPSVGTHTVEYGGTATYSGSDVSVRVKTIFTVR